MLFHAMMEFCLDLLRSKFWLIGEWAILAVQTRVKRVVGFLRVLRFPSTGKVDMVHYDHNAVKKVILQLL